VAVVPGVPRMEVIPDFKSVTLITFLKQNVSQAQRCIPTASRVSPGCKKRVSNTCLAATPANRTAERGQIGGASGRPGDWQPEAVVIGPTTALVVVSSRFISMSSSFATIVGSYPWPRSRPCSVSERGAANQLQDDLRRCGRLQTRPQYIGVC